MTDSAGNSTFEIVLLFQLYTLDDVNPTISSFGADDTTVPLKISNQSQTVTFTAVASDNHGVNAVNFDNNRPYSSSGNTHTYLKLIHMVHIVHSVIVVIQLHLTATDTAGNTSTSSQLLQLQK